MRFLALFLLCGLVQAQQSFLINPYLFTPSSLNTNLVSYWKLDETSGTRIDAVTATGNDLTDNNTVTSNPGIIVNAGQFTAASSEWLTHTSNSSLQTGDIDFTFAAWVYLDATGTAMTILAKYGATTKEYWLRYENTGVFSFCVFATGTAGCSTIQATTFGAPATATWYHIIAWHDSVNNSLGICVNGGTPDTVSYSSGITALAGDFGMGALPTVGQYWNGRIDEVGFWKKVLNSAERDELYNSGAGKTCCPFP